MADNYLASTTYVDAHVGGQIRTTLCSDDDVYDAGIFTQLGVSATAAIKAAIKSTGYTAPSDITTTASDDAEYLKLATLGVWQESAYNRPDHDLALPDNWETTQQKLAMDNVLSGDAVLDLPQSTVDAIGGYKVSEWSPSVSSADNSRTPIFSRKNLRGL